ncbi:MAG TPA: alpha/beta fold hydrolase [Terriglobales bacterium]|nr:alpha/beta fold hydrolase [Terriglobales bacterium]
MIRILLVFALFPPALAAVAGWMLAPAFLHPLRKQLTADQIRDAQITFAQIGAYCDEFDVRAPDGVLLRGWKVRPAHPTGSWVLVYHGVADNRMGVLEHARILLLAGYGVVMMDSRAHGASEGPIATYGWLERKDTSAVLDALLASEKPAHIFALGESMGAGIALQSAGADPRIEAVVAEAPFANLLEAAYDYAGLREYPWLGRTLFAPGAWMLIYRGERLAGFPGAEISPEKAVAARAFPVFLICDGNDHALPCRHSEMIFNAARGPKEFWRVPGAIHTGALGEQPREFRRRVLEFLEKYRSG